jgi:trimeric autotransporter adhesin
MKTKKIMAGLIVLAGLGGLMAQNSAYTPNGPAAIAGINCSAFGFQALFANNANAFQNSATGHRALFQNTTGNDNTANGYRALSTNITGSQNTGIGSLALVVNNGWDNTAAGFRALAANTNGAGNCAFGKDAMLNMISGGYNTANGTAALLMNTSGMENTACGHAALYFNTGDWNTAAGVNALQTATGDNNTAVGYNSLIALTTGNNNTGLGFMSDVSAGNLTNATAIGNGAIVNASDRVWLGNAVATVWTAGSYNISDQRFKSSVSTDDVKGLEFINLLRPVVYNLETQKITEFMTKNMSEKTRKQHMDMDFSKSTAQRRSGFIAQEVEAAAKKCSYNFDGVHVPESDVDTYGLSYAEFVVPLVKAVQQMDKNNGEQKQEIAQLKQQLQEQKQLITELQQKNGSATGIGAVSSDLPGFSMGQNEPNPFTHETVIKYTLPQSITSAYMAVYDLTGKQITTLPLDQKGSSSITITSQKLAAGIYIYSIVADGKVMDSKRMIVADK